jgi:structure-specific recognition protein 1
MCAFTKRKVIRPKVSGFNGEKEDKFKSIRCSLKANEGFLYPLDKCFFFIANKPVQLDFERIGSLEFNRVDKGTVAQAARTFDITIHMRDGSNHQFVNLQRSDYKELFNFLTNKSIKIRNLAAANKNAEEADDESGEDEADDPYMDRVKRQRAAAQATDLDLGDEEDDDSEEDEDFAPADVSDVDEEYEEGAEVVDGETAGKSKKKAAKVDDDAPAASASDDEGSGSDADAPKLPPKKKAKADADKGKKAAPAEKGKKSRKKKDKDAPKRGMSGYMIYMNANRERYKQEHPGAKVTEIGKFAGEEWRAMDAEAKAPWEGKAKADKERYEREMKEYTEAKRAALAEATSSEDEGEAAGAGGSSDEE